MKACLLLFVLLTPVGHAQWKRFVDGEYFDEPRPHKLEYFLVHPCLRSLKNDLRGDCSPEPASEQVQAWKAARIGLKQIGKIGALTVYDVFYQDQGAEKPFQRSVLIEVTPDRVYEVDVVGEIAWTGAIVPTEILRLKSGAIISTDFDDGGIYVFNHRNFFLVTGEQMQWLDFSPLYLAAVKRIPNELELWQPTVRVDLNAMVFEISAVEKNPKLVSQKVACCQLTVRISFKIIKDRLIARRVVVVPYPRDE